MPDSTSRQPRGVVRVAGLPVPWYTIEVTTNGLKEADSFEIVFATKALPDSRNAAWFSQQKTIDIEVFASAKPADAANYVPQAGDRMILGEVDDISYDPVARSITITGRDYTAKLIDTKTSEHFVNQTSSQIATTLAGRHGLTPVVTATSTRVGTYFTNDHTDLTQQQSEWALLNKLADYENFSVYVTGNELHFEPRPDTSAAAYPIKWTEPNDDTAYPEAPVVDLSFSRSLTIVKGLKIVVRSWNTKQKKAFEVSWPRNQTSPKPGTTGAAPADGQTFTRTIPGLTKDEALKRAQSLYAQIASHAMKLTGTLPGDAVLTSLSQIVITGTGTAFDQSYFPTEIRRELSVADGFTMSVEAKNISPELDVE